jgi:hypothetical protein
MIRRRKIREDKLRQRKLRQDSVRKGKLLMTCFTDVGVKRSQGVLVAYTQSRSFTRNQLTVYRR